MNLDEWIKLPPEQFAKRLREAQMTREQYDRAVAEILADQRMVEEMRATGTLPTKPPAGKLGDGLIYGVPKSPEDAEQAIRNQVFGIAKSRVDPDEAALVAQVVAGLPKAMSMQARRNLGQVVYLVKHTPKLQRPTKSRRGELLRRIAKVAGDLDALHRELHRDHATVAKDILPEQLARRRLKGALIPAELAQAEGGLTRDALGHVLRAVVEHMAAIEELHPMELKRPPLPHGRILRSALVDAYTGSGLTVSDRKEFADHLEGLLDLAGLGRTSVEKLIAEMDEFKLQPAEPRK